MSKAVQAVGSVFNGDAFGKSGGGAPAAVPKTAASTTLDDMADTTTTSRGPNVYSAGAVSSPDGTVLGGGQTVAVKRRAASRTLLG